MWGWEGSLRKPVAHQKGPGSAANLGRSCGLEENDLNVTSACRDEPQCGTVWKGLESSRDLADVDHSLGSCSASVCLFTRSLPHTGYTDAGWRQPGLRFSAPKLSEGGCRPFLGSLIGW